LHQYNSFTKYIENIRTHVYLIKKSILLVWRNAKIWSIVSIGVLFVQAILPIAALYLMKQIVDAVTSQTLSFDLLVFFIILAGVVAFLSILAASIASFVSEAQSLVVTDHIQDLLHEKSVAVDLEYYEKLHRAQEQAINRPTAIVRGLQQLFRSAFSLIALFVLLVSLSPLITVFLVLAAVPTAYIRFRYSRRFYQWHRKVTIHERKARYHHRLLTTDTYAKEIRLFNLSSVFRTKYQELRKILRRERLQLILKRSIFDVGTQAISIFVVFASLAFIAGQTYLGVLSVGTMVMFFGAVQQGRSFLNTFFSSITQLYENNLFLSNLYEFLDLKPTVQNPKTPVAFPDAVKKGISISKMHFTYPGTTTEVLKDVSLTISPGEMIALVGENGSGKTTLAKLLCRLYDPTEGIISFEGVDLRDFDISKYRGSCSVMFQDYARYNFTAKENIMLGDISSTCETSMMQAADCADAHEFISLLPAGYDTMLGKWFEKGSELSVGEWQKIALARSFMRDAGFIILDEPTSAFDPRAEDKIIQTFQKLAAGKMSVVISHRLSTVTMADRIYFLKKGRIIEQGSHKELMRLRGEYAQLFETQAKHYRYAEEDHESQ